MNTNLMDFTINKQVCTVPFILLFLFSVIGYFLIFYEFTRGSEQTIYILQPQNKVPSNWAVIPAIHGLGDNKWTLTNEREAF